MTREQKIRLAIAWMRRSHNIFVNSDTRNDDILAGERAYQRWRKQCQRATRATA